MEGQELATGVYKITNKVNGKMYVGSSAVSLTGRIRSHRKNLRLGTHANQYLLRAYQKYGSKSFVYSVLERCSSEECLKREQYWIDYYNSADERYGYNLYKTAGSPLGMKMSLESRMKISLALTGKPGTVHTEETKRKISLSKKGRSYGEGFREKIRAVRTGWKLSEETKKKIGVANSLALKGRKKGPLSEETRAKLSARFKGKPLTEETKKKMSESRKGVPWSLARRAACGG